jgi:AcrR family transcriptional regulator
MRAVAREAGVALGLVDYHYDDKTSLIRAALRHIEDQDITLVEPDPSPAQAGEEFERINTEAQGRYRAAAA